MEFIEVKSYDQLLEGDPKSIQEKVEDYTISLKNRISPNSFGMRLAPIFLFYALNDIILNVLQIVLQLFQYVVAWFGGRLLQFFNVGFTDLQRFY